MAQTVAATAAATKALNVGAPCPPTEPATSPANSVARPCLQTEVDRSGLPRKAIAQDVLGRNDESQFSKMVSGGRPFDLDDLDRLPRPVLVAFVKRYCAALGLTVPRELELAEVTDDLLTHIERLFQIAKLARVGKATAAKAHLR